MMVNAIGSHGIATRSWHKPNINIMKTTAKMAIIETVRMMAANINKFNGSNDYSWDASIDDVMNRFSVSQHDAIVLMRAAMSVTLNELHPSFKF